MKLFFFCLSLFAVNFAWAYGIGQSSLPLPAGKKLISTEASGIVSDGGGVGLQARYVQKLTQPMLFDAGFGVSGGDRSNRLFAGLDYEIFPDYERQPRVSIKTTYENAKEYKYRQNILSIAPTVSKGVSFRGREGFPYIAIPVGLSLENQTKTYQTTAQVNLGLNTPLPLGDFEKLIAHGEVFLNLKDSFSGALVGLSYPLN
ncbi:MAG: hypothetical protein WCG27_05005 [Pseudomonadota bacterium]